MEEKTTLNESLIFVISLKSEIIEDAEMEEFILLNASVFVANNCDGKDTLKINYEQRLT